MKVGIVLLTSRYLPSTILPSIVRRALSASMLLSNVTNPNPWSKPNKHNIMHSCESQAKLAREHCGVKAILQLAGA